MLDRKYFYILCRDGQILEVLNKKETFDAVLNAMLDKGVVALKDYGTILNGVDISRVLNADQYDNWVYSTNPREYLKDGVWRDGKEKKVIRYEPWKQKEIDERKKLNESEERELSAEETKKLLEKYKPDFMKEAKHLSNKMRV